MPTEKNFKSERISKTATIIVNAEIAAAFPLFGAFEERKWATGWNPTLIYPLLEIIEEGTTFKTKGYGNDEDDFFWRVSKYNPGQYFIEYFVFTQNRYWTIEVKCFPASDNKTLAEVTYTYTGLNQVGNNINRNAVEEMFKENLKDWQEEINSYLAK